MRAPSASPASSLPAGCRARARFLQRQAGEEAQFGDARLATLEGSELVQRRVEIEHVDLERRCTGGVFHEKPNQPAERLKATVC
jgi:hypothetical protein